MAGIAVQQLRLDTNPGIEGADGGGTEGAIRVKAGTGLTNSSNGVDVDGSAASFKTPCRLKTSADVTLAGGAPDTVDGVSVNLGDRILVADQTTTSEDGIYEVQTVGTGSNGTWVRTADAPVGGGAAGWYIQVLEGTLENLYKVDANLGGATIGTDDWSLTVFSGGASRTAGLGLTDGAGNDLDVNTGDGIAVSSDRVVTQVATAVAAQQYGGLVRTRSSDGSAAGTANQGYLAVQTDNSTLEINSSNQVALQLDSTQTFVAPVSWSFPVGVTAQGLFAVGTPQDANHVVNKAYVDNFASGVSWLEPLTCICLVGNRTVAQINGLGNPGAVSDVYVVTDAGTLTLGSLAVAAGDVVQWDNDNTQWIKIVSNSGGFVPSGTRFSLNTGTALVSPYTDGVDDGKIVQFDGTNNDPLTSGTVTVSDNGDAVLVVAVPGETPPVLVNTSYVFNGTVPTGSWTQFSGAGGLNAGTGLSTSGNTINFNTADASLTVNADDVQVNLDGATVPGGNVASVVTLTANGLALSVDDSTIEASAAGGQLRVKDLGITTAKLAANAVSLAKTDIRFREEEFTAASFTNTSPSTVDLAVPALIGTQADFYVEVYRNGVADMTNQGSGGTVSSATQFKLDNTGGGGVGRVSIGANISATGNTYRVKYLSLAV